MKQEYRPLNEQSVINTLLSLRSQITRDRLDGLEEVEKLLVLRGVDLSGHHIPRKTAKHFKRHELRNLVMAELRKSPAPARQISEAIFEKHNSLAFSTLHYRVRLCLAGARRKGVVECGQDGAWKRRR